MGPFLLPAPCLSLALVLSGLELARVLRERNPALIATSLDSALVVGDLVLALIVSGRSPAIGVSVLFLAITINDVGPALVAREDLRPMLGCPDRLLVRATSLRPARATESCTDQANARYCSAAV